MVLSKFRYLQNGFSGIVFSLIMPQHLTIFSIGCEALQVHPFYNAKTGIAGGSGFRSAKSTKNEVVRCGIEGIEILNTFETRREGRGSDFNVIIFPM